MLTGEEIRQTARATISVLNQHGLEAYLFGSAACAIYGMKNREPNDIDVVVITRRSQESIKRLIAESSSNFYSLPSTNPRNTYRVLWYKSTSDLQQDSNAVRSFKCKVDILVPGLLDIPDIPAHRIVYVEPHKDIPVGPFVQILLLKLKGWADHLADYRSYMREKIETDHADIEELLNLAVNVYGARLSNEAWLPNWFIEAARGRVRRYIVAWPPSRNDWTTLGF